MNKEQTKEAIKVMQAYVYGKNVELLKPCSLEWIDQIEPAWDWGVFKYRIKPELREWYINTKTGMATEAKHGCCVYYKSSIGELVKVREVLDDKP